MSKLIVFKNGGTEIHMNCDGKAMKIKIGNGPIRTEKFKSVDELNEFLEDQKKN